jgi:hypothetical protein
MADIIMGDKKGLPRSESEDVGCLISCEIDHTQFEIEGREQKGLDVHTSTYIVHNYRNRYASEHRTHMSGKQYFISKIILKEKSFSGFGEILCPKRS